MEYLPDLEELIAGFLADRRLIGVSLALLQNGEIAELGGYGQTRLDNAGTAVDADTLFAYGSVCKTLCATLVMKLVEQGALELDKPLAAFLPRLRFDDAALGARVTLRHVLSHTTGLPAWGRSRGPAGPGALAETLYTEIPHYRFLAPPGTFHLYSNVVYCLAGLAAEAVTGQPYAELVAERIFEPLGMRRTTFDLAEAITRPIALPHRRDDGHVSVRSRLSHNDAGTPSSFGYGSTLDLAQLACLFLNEGRVAGRAFLSAASVAAMQTPQTHLHVDSAAHPFATIYTGYGLGMQTGRYRSHRVARHGGVTPGYQTFFDLFPDRRCGVVAQMTILDEPAAMEVMMAAWDTVLGRPPRGTVYAPAPTPAATLPADLDRLAGTYLNVARGDLAEIRVGEAGLSLTWNGVTNPLTFTGSGHLYAKRSAQNRVPVYFLPAAEAIPRTVLVYGNPYERVKEGPVAEAADWRGLTGRYRDPFNSDPAEVVDVFIAAGALRIAADGREAPLIPHASRSFRSPLGLVDFAPADGGPAPWLQIGRAARYYRETGS